MSSLVSSVEPEERCDAQVNSGGGLQSAERPRLQEGSAQGHEEDNSGSTVGVWETSLPLDSHPLPVLRAGRTKVNTRHHVGSEESQMGLS